MISFQIGGVNMDVSQYTATVGVRLKKDQAMDKKRGLSTEGWVLGGRQGFKSLNFFPQPGG